MTTYGTTRESLLKDMSDTPGITGIRTETNGIAVLSYIGTADGKHRFYKILPETAADISCIDTEDAAYGAESVSFSREEYDRILGTERGYGKRYSGMLFKAGETIIAPGTSASGRHAMKSLKKAVTGYFQGTISDEFRNMYAAVRLIDIENDIAICYRESETDGNIIRPIGFIALPWSPYSESNRRLTEKEKTQWLWNEVTANIRKAFGKKEAADMLRGEEKTCARGDIRLMHISPSEMEVLHMTGHINGKYTFMAIDPRVSEEMFRMDKRVRIVSIKRETAEKMGIDEETLERDGFMLMAKDENGKVALIRSGRGFANNICRIAGQKEKLCEGIAPIRDLIIARGIFNNTRMKSANISVQDLWTDDRVRLCRGIKLTRADRSEVRFAEAYSTVEKEMLTRGFVLKSWRRDETDYTIDFVFTGGKKTPVPVAAGRYENVTAGAELQMAGEIGTAYRLCGVFYCGDSVFYCGDSTYRKGEKRYGAVYAQRKSGDSLAFLKLANGFFYGDPFGEKETGVVSPFEYLLKQAGLTENGISIFDAMAYMAPAEETNEVMSIVKDGKKARRERYGVAKRIGKKQIEKRACSVNLEYSGWSKLDTVMLLADISRNEKADLSRKRMSMECLGDMLAAV